MIDSNAIERLILLLRQKKKKLVTAESLTGGLICSEITKIAGVSDVFWGGFVVYSVQAKILQLGCSEAVIEKYGAVSVQTARAMAEGALRKSLVLTGGADYSVAVTGLAGPSGGCKRLPVGTVCFAVSYIKSFDELCSPVLGFVENKLEFKGSRSCIREKTVDAAVKMLLTLIE